MRYWSAERRRECLPLSGTYTVTVGGSWSGVTVRISDTSNPYGEYPRLVVGDTCVLSGSWCCRYTAIVTCEVCGGRRVIESERAEWLESDDLIAMERMEQLVGADKRTP